VFAKGDIVQFVGYGPNFADWVGQENHPPIASIHTVLEVIQDEEGVGFTSADPTYICIDSSGFYYHAGFRLISRPDPEVLLEKQPVHINFITEPA